jgi:hypothetical protein
MFIGKAQIEGVEETISIPQQKQQQSHCKENLLKGIGKIIAAILINK